MSEGQDKKGGFLQRNSSEIFSKSKIQGIFEPSFASRRIKQQIKTHECLNNFSTNKVRGKLCRKDVSDRHCQ